MNPFTTQDCLETYFGFTQFRDPQKAIIDSILSGQDTLVVMPTGRGKSLCYQLPALVKSGITLVVSPLISLMQDQVEALRKKGIPATFLNSSLTPKELDERLYGIQRGNYKLVYVAPERFRNRYFFSFIRTQKITLFAVDEAHCISQWGHDFRPEYLRLGEIAAALGRPTIIALTATATRAVQEDIIRNLHMNACVRFVAGFSRPNLAINILHTAKHKDKWNALAALIKRQKTGIIYCATRKQVEKVCEYLKEDKQPLVMYHAGLSDFERQRAQNLFLEGKIPIAVATNAFGMGIDRPDIRFVAHFEMPGSVEAYYQEIGRAGRDGEHAECELYYNYADKRIQEFFIEGSNPLPALIRSVYYCLIREADKEGIVRLSIEELAQALPASGKNVMAVGTSLSILSQLKAIERFDIPGSRIRGTRILSPSTGAHQLNIHEGALEEKRRRDMQRLHTMLQFATAQGCRENWILEYFGENAQTACKRCDGCKKLTPRPNQTTALLTTSGPSQKAFLKGLEALCFRSNDGTLRPRLGKAKALDVFLGKNTKPMQTGKWTEHVAFGLFKGECRLALEALFSNLEAQGLVEVVRIQKFPLVRPSNAGLLMARAL